MPQFSQCLWPWHYDCGRADISESSVIDSNDDISQSPLFPQERRTSLQDGKFIAARPSSPPEKIATIIEDSIEADKGIRREEHGSAKSTDWTRGCQHMWALRCYPDL